MYTFTRSPALSRIHSCADPLLSLQRLVMRTHTHTCPLSLLQSKKADRQQKRRTSSSASGCPIAPMCSWLPSSVQRVSSRRTGARITRQPLSLPCTSHTACRSAQRLNSACPAQPVSQEHACGWHQPAIWPLAILRSSLSERAHREQQRRQEAERMDAEEGSSNKHSATGEETEKRERNGAAEENSAGQPLPLPTKQIGQVQQADRETNGQRDG